MALESLVIPSIRNVIYAAYASLPTSGVTVGDLGYATDRKVLYRWSGSAWQPIGISSRSGAAADIGTASDYPAGSLYQATDTSTLYMQIGGSWTAIVTPPQFSAAYDVTGSRAKDTVYQNTTGVTMAVVVSVESSSAFEAIAYCDSSTPPTTVVCKQSAPVRLGAAWAVCVFLVPNNDYYKVTGAVGTVSIEAWIEYY